MRKRRRRAPTRYRDDYYDEGDYSSRYPRRRGPLHIIQRFFVTLLWVLTIIVAFVLLLLIAFNFAFFIKVLVYVLFIGAGLGILWVLYLAVRLIVSISLRISEARRASALAKQEQVRVKQEQERIKLAQSKRARDEYAFYQKQHPAERYQDCYYESPRRTRVIRDEEASSRDQVPSWRASPYQTRVLAQQGQMQPSEPEEQSELEQLGMPPKGSVFAYRDYKRYLTKRGQLLVGVRKDGTARIGSWQEFKIVLILGSSSSGKSTTVLEKCLCMVDDGGLLIICDPGGFKPDSLIQRLGSLQDALMPGTILAIEHEEIMQNIERFRVELERRRRGADMATPILLVIDELNGLLMDKDIKKELTELLERFAQQARGYNMYMVLCAQRASGLAAIRNSVISFICHRCPEMEANKILPARYARLAPQLGTGQTFVSDADGNIDSLQQSLITKQDLAIHRRTTPAIPQRSADSQQRPATTQDRAALRRSRLAAQLSSTPTTSTVPKLTKNLQPQQPAGAIWSEALPGKLVLPPAPDTQQRKPQGPNTEDLDVRQAPTTGDVVQQSQVSTAQQKLDRLAELRAARRNKK